MLTLDVMRMTSSLTCYAFSKLKDHRVYHHTSSAAHVQRL